jgi:SAM-dependent methyltransferase
MTAKANVEKWGNYWKRFRASLTHQVYLESVSDIISRRIEGISSGDRRLLILDIGCGQSQLDVFIAEKTGCQIMALDIIEEALKVGKRLVEERKLHGQVSLIRASVYQLPFPDNSFDIVVSTGSESAAAYHGATEEAGRVVVKDGRLFIDFIRMPNLYQPLRSIRSYFQYKEANRKRRLGEETKYSHYGKLGLRKRFENGLGLKIQKIWRMNNAPPLGGIKTRLRFERTLGKLLSPLLARTILVEFLNKK